MPFQRKRPSLALTERVRRKLEAVSGATRTEAQGRIERANILLGYADGETVSALARRLQTNRPKVERCIDKALQIGAIAALDDLPRPGKPASITPEARAWVISLACQRPKDLGYSYELWTTRLLAQHVQGNCQAAGHPALAELARGTVSKLLRQSKVRPHKIAYYVERRDPEFEDKMAQVLYVYKEVQMLRESHQENAGLVAYLSYDEKPGIQAIGNTSPDRMPQPGEHPVIYRDYEYVRHGTLSLLAGIDLISGEIHGIVRSRHRSAEFVEFLQLADSKYPPGTLIRVVLDNHSAHISKETKAYLKTVPNRFEFTFTPKHGSWLNLIESFFGKMTRTMLRGIRVSSAEELASRIQMYLDEVNRMPVVYRWKYGLDDVTVA
jgi:transposase